MHVFDPARFPYAAQRAYTPAAATVEDLQALHARMGMARTVLVQPSVYGTDNSCLLAALHQLGLGRARGIAVVDPATVSDLELWDLHEAGVRGIRLNLHVQGRGMGAAKQQLAGARRVLKMPGWSLQVHACLDVVTCLLDDMQRLEKPVVLDHYAGGLAPEPDSDVALGRLLAAMRNAPLYVKLSAPYRLWPGQPVQDLARTFYGAGPDRVLWGSDWPHTGGSGGSGRTPGTLEPFRAVDNQEVLQTLLGCLPDAAARHRLLVDNPAALYGFDR
ncbi:MULTISPECIES: amidohydrolase family protein [Ramlibacter]|uniref:amidohydrolase family protein n=1 Tax=Ramlibacter TaxID=174951 RepID=UPI0012FC3983|nr:amidohydrolase family protein [Ramlibacter sp. CGMCC 1.13660]